MTAYTLGFAFIFTWNRPPAVVLIRKAKPQWQAGKLNGVGGRIEDRDDTCVDGMVREFQEETGCATNPKDWVKFTEMRFAGDHGNGSDVIVHCFATILQGHQTVKTMTQEEVEIHYLSELLKVNEFLPNLAWLIPMAHYAIFREHEDNSIPHTLDHV